MFADVTIDRVIELENKLRESEMNNRRLQDEVKSLTNIQKNQGKELNRIMGNQEYENKIKSLNEEAKKARERVKELEKRLAAETSESQKSHILAGDLRDKYVRLKEEQKNLKSGSPLPDQSYEKEEKKDAVEVLQTSINSLQRMIRLERSGNKKLIESLLQDKANMQSRLKEIEQENRVGAIKVTEMKRSVRHNQLRPLPCSDLGEVTAERRSPSELPEDMKPVKSFEGTEKMIQEKKPPAAAPAEKRQEEKKTEEKKEGAAVGVGQTKDEGNPQQKAAPVNVQVNPPVAQTLEQHQETVAVAPTQLQTQPQPAASQAPAAVSAEGAKPIPAQPVPLEAEAKKECDGAK